MSSWDTQCRRTCHKTREKINERVIVVSGESGEGGEGWGGKVQTVTGRKEGGMEGGRDGGREVHYSATFYTTVPLTTRNTLTLVSLQWYLAASNFCKCTAKSTRSQGHYQMCLPSPVLLQCCHKTRDWTSVGRNKSHDILAGSHDLVFGSHDLVLGSHDITWSLDSPMPQ